VASGGYEIDIEFLVGTHTQAVCHRIGNWETVKCAFFAVLHRR